VEVVSLSLFYLKIFENKNGWRQSSPVLFILFISRLYIYPVKLLRTAFGGFNRVNTLANQAP